MQSSVVYFLIVKPVVLLPVPSMEFIVDPAAQVVALPDPLLVWSSMQVPAANLPEKRTVAHAFVAYLLYSPIDGGATPHVDISHVSADDDFVHARLLSDGVSVVFAVVQALSVYMVSVSLLLPQTFFKNEAP